MSTSESSENYLSLKNFFGTQRNSKIPHQFFSQLSLCPILKLSSRGKLTWNKGFVCFIRFLRFRLTPGCAWAIVSWSSYLILSFLPKFWFQGWFCWCLLLSLPTMFVLHLRNLVQREGIVCSVFLKLPFRKHFSKMIS